MYSTSDMDDLQGRSSKYLEDEKGKRPDTVRDKEKIERLLAEASVSSHMDTQYLLDIDRELLRRIRNLERERQPTVKQQPVVLVKPAPLKSRSPLVKLMEVVETVLERIEEVLRPAPRPKTVKVDPAPFFEALLKAIERAVEKGIDDVRDSEKVRRLNGGTTGSITSGSEGVIGTRRRSK